MHQEVIEFPHLFDLKVIMYSTESDTLNQDLIRGVLSALNIPHEHWRSRPSQNRTYTSYTVKVVVNTRDTFDALYCALGKLSGIKMVL